MSTEDTVQTITVNIHNNTDQTLVVAAQNGWESLPPNIRPFSTTTLIPEQATVSPDVVEYTCSLGILGIGASAILPPTWEVTINASGGLRATPPSPVLLVAGGVVDVYVTAA